jgi:hypothetical protein
MLQEFTKALQSQRETNPNEKKYLFNSDLGITETDVIPPGAIYTGIQTIANIDYLEYVLLTTNGDYSTRKYYYTRDYSTLPYLNYSGVIPYTDEIQFTTIQPNKQSNIIIPVSSLDGSICIYETSEYGYTKSNQAYTISTPVGYNLTHPLISSLVFYGYTCVVDNQLMYIYKESDSELYKWQGYLCISPYRPLNLTLSNINIRLYYDTSERCGYEMESSIYLPYPGYYTGIYSDELGIRLYQYYNRERGVSYLSDSKPSKRMAEVWGALLSNKTLSVEGVNWQFIDKSQRYNVHIRYSNSNLDIYQSGNIITLNTKSRTLN